MPRYELDGLEKPTPGMSACEAALDAANRGLGTVLAEFKISIDRESTIGLG